MIRPAPAVLSAAAVVLLAACATAPGGSYVGPLQQPADAEVLADAVAEFVSTRLPAAASTVALGPTPRDQAGNPVTAALAAVTSRA